MDILKYIVLVISILVFMSGLVASAKLGDIAVFFFGFLIACATCRSRCQQSGLGRRRV